MDPIRRAVAEFSEAVARPEERVDLVDAALRIAGLEYPGLDRAAHTARLEQMGHDAAHVCTAPPVIERLRRLSRLLYEEWGFHGNVREFHDPRNSYLNEVLDRRTGIPITLALVYIRTGAGAGLALHGVGMPGRFLVGAAEIPGLYIDPFSRGEILDAAACERLFRAGRSGEPFTPAHLRECGPRPFLMRMLNNLFGIFLNTGDLARAGAVVEMQRAVDADDPEPLRRRVLVHRAAGNFIAAHDDLKSYLAVRPGASDAASLHRQLELLGRLRQSIH